MKAMTLSAGSERARAGPRVALVTGGGKGLGAAIAARLAAEGLKGAVLGRVRLALERVAREIGGISVEADVTDDEAMRRALDRVHETSFSLSVLVQNAG